MGREVLPITGSGFSLFLGAEGTGLSPGTLVAFSCLFLHAMFLPTLLSHMLGSPQPFPVLTFKPQASPFPFISMSFPLGG